MLSDVGCAAQGGGGKGLRAGQRIASGDIITRFDGTVRMNLTVTCAH